MLLKNDGVLPLSPSMKKVALIGPWHNSSVAMQGSYQGYAPYLVTPLDAFLTAGFDITALNGTSISGDDSSQFIEAIAAAQAADLVVFMGGIDNSIEQEALDRNDITWPGVQLDLIADLAAVGKPFVVVQFGGGQLDDSWLQTNDKVRPEMTILSINADLSD